MSDDIIVQFLKSINEHCLKENNLVTQEMKNHLKDQITKSPKNVLLYIFQLIVMEKMPYTKNNNGIFINLNKLNPELLLKIKTYLDNVKVQA